jgi:hypothetical protein
MARINDIVISDMAFNAMVRKMHNRIIGCQNLFEIQQSNDDKVILQDYVDDSRERNKKLKMWEEEWQWERIEFKKKRKKEREEDLIAEIEFKKKRQKEREEDLIAVAKAKQKKIQDKYILKLQENSHRNEVFYDEMNTTLNKYDKIIIKPQPNIQHYHFYNNRKLEKSAYILKFFKEKNNVVQKTERFFGNTIDYKYNYTILKHKILDKMIEIAKHGNFTSIEHIRFVFTKPTNSVKVFLYLSDICLFEIDLPEF